MISFPSMLLAAVISAAGIVCIGALLRWPLRQSLKAAMISFALLILWRGLSNALSLNTDFLPAVSIGDSGCLLMGAVGPSIVALPKALLRPVAMPFVVGAGLVAFVVNVAVL